MKSMVEAECGGPNALVGLAQNYGGSNQRIAPTISRGASSLLPSSSLGEQFAHDFLQQKALEAKAPSTFSMKKEQASNEGSGEEGVWNYLEKNVGIK
ncbi:hypothetical protein TELCIR_15635, partial [Teladorsagia circumcincta]